MAVLSMPNTYHTILCQALRARVGLRVTHENPRSAIQRFRQEKAKDKVLFAPLRFFPSPTNPAEVWIIKDSSHAQPSADRGTEKPVGQHPSSQSDSGCESGHDCL